MDGRSGKGSRRVLIAIAIVLAVLGCAFAWYVSDYYHADDVALTAVADEDGDADGVVVRELSGGAIAFVPDDPVAGLVFYPGAKVQPESYAPLAQACAERGILFVIVRPLFNLALLDEGCADGVTGQFPDVGEWAVGGHSMGGVAAGDYALRHGGDFALVVFLASYPSADLSALDCAALSVVASNDAVLNWERYEEARALLPSGAREVVIEGGVHSYFGDYGAQAGDGAALVSREEQQSLTAEAIADALDRSA